MAWLFDYVSFIFDDVFPQANLKLENNQLQNSVTSASIFLSYPVDDDSFSFLLTFQVWESSRITEIMEENRCRNFTWKFLR